jgi:hypothetical protein
MIFAEYRTSVDQARKRCAGKPSPMVARGNSIIAGQRRQLDQMIDLSVPSLTIEPLHRTW